MQIAPMYSRVIVKLEEAEEKTAGGIILTGNQKQQPIFGTVVAVGPGTAEYPMLLNVGDMVIPPEKALRVINVDGQDYSVYEESDLLAMLQNDPEGETNE